MNKIKMIGDNVLIDMIDEVTNDRGDGLVIPEMYRKKPNEGKIVAVSDDSSFEVGSTVLLTRDCGVEVTVDGKVYHIVPNDSILAVVN